MNITPDTHVLESMRSQRLGWADLLAELIDNSLDAKASQIKIYIDPRTVQIIDDGIGCSNLGAMFTPGAHRPHAGGGGLGRYGIGFKDAALSLWGVTKVESVKEEVCYTAGVDWEKLKKSKHWDVPDPVDSPAVGRPSGTIVTFQKITKEIPSGTQLEKLIKQLSFLFAPAIRKGKQIVFHHHKLTTPQIAQPFDWPNREDVKDGVITVRNREVHVNIGIVPEGVPNPRAGLSYFFRHRIIIPSSSLGCGDYSSSRILGWVDLQSEQWRLTKNKDDISEYREDLAAAVEQLCRPVLELAGFQAHHIHLKELNMKITSHLRELAAGSKPQEKEKRERGDSEGTVEPKDTGRKRETSGKKQPGHKLLGNLSKGLRFELADLPEDLLWLVDAPGNTIRIAKNHSYVQSVLTLSADAQERELSILALTAIVDHLATMPGTNRVFPGMGDLPEEKRMSIGLGKLLTSFEAKTAKA